MTPPIPDRIRSKIIKLLVDTSRYEADLAGRVDKMVMQLGQDLIKQLMGSGIDTPLTDWQRARLQALLKEATKTVKGSYEDMASTVSDELTGLIQISGKGLAIAMNEAIGANLMVAPKWTKEQLRSLVDGSLVQGAPSAEWWSRQGQDLAQAFADQMRQGMLRGETITQLRDRIMGMGIRGVGSDGKVDLRTVARDLRSPIKTARRNAEALVRTSVISAANTAHLEAYRANADIMAGIEWLSTLDHKTTAICRGLDGLRWDLDLNPIGHSIQYPGPTAHWGCRSTTLAVTKSWEDLARETHGNSTIAKELDSIPEGDRASMGGPVSGKLSYTEWFDQQSASTQEDILGKKKLQIYQRGHLSFVDMIDQRGNPLTLKQLEEIYG